MQIYVGKNGQQLGPFSIEEINRKLADGTFAGSDLAWYEGAAGWGPLSGVAGVVIPQAPTAAPAPAPIQPTPAAAAVRPNVPIVQAAPRSTKTFSLVSWLLLGITFVVSFIPIVGCGSWILVWPVAIAAIIMGIMVLTRGGTVQGILIILASILLVPIALVAPIITTALLGGADRAKETGIMENLRSIDLAKTQFTTEKNPATGAPVTMANLTSYFGGKEIKPVVGETYDPMPVGQPPTAMLPANKTLGTFSGGDVLTVGSIETALASNTSFNWSAFKNTTASPSPSLTSAKPSATPSSAPSVTVSPKPSVSPRASASPHSLISPRQNVEPEESPSSPSSRPSPSAKFAPPRKGPQPNPRQSPSEPEESSGLRHGKQQPSESPSATPDDDDD